MLRDIRDRIKWHLRLGEPGPIERAAIAVAAQELSDVEVDLPTWQRATDGARGDAHARVRYIKARVADLRRELRDGSSALLNADRSDQRLWADTLERRVADYRATPEGEAAYRVALGVALKGVWTFSLIYYSVVLLLILLMVWLVPR